MTNSNLPPSDSYNAKRTAVLFTRFTSIWGHRWKQIIDEVGLEIALEEWSEAIKSVPDDVIKSALAYCRNNLEWSPSIAEFLKICDQEQGMPTPEEVLQLAIRRDFSHPITEAIYNKIGSWDLSHGTEKDLIAKVRRHYAEYTASQRKPALPAITDESPDLDELT